MAEVIDNYFSIQMNNILTEDVSVGDEECPNMLLSYSVVHVLCHGAKTGSIDVIPINNVGAVTYNWGLGQPTTQDRTAMAAGTYTIIATDSVGNSATEIITITQPPSIVLTTTQQNVVCNGAETGSINLIVSGGTGVYTYEWTKNSIPEPVTTQDRSGIGAGLYNVVVTDSNGCISQIGIEISQPSALTITPNTHTDVLCFGASTGGKSVTVTGGITPYRYNWGTGETPNNFVTGLPAGSRTLTVTDASNCVAVLPYTILQPAAALSVSKTSVNNTVNGGTAGSIDITPAGGTSPYTYVWRTGGYNSPNPIISTNEDISGLAAGTYYLTITDANNCTLQNSTVITHPVPLSLSETHVNVLCHGASTGSINLTVSGGVSPYTYLWNTGATTEDLSSRPAGTYSVTVTDASSATATLSGIVITQTDLIVITAVKTNANTGMNNGAIDVTITGGYSGGLGFRYFWNTVSSPLDISGLATGNYSLNVIDGYNCFKSLAIINISNALYATSTKIDDNVDGTPNNGSIDLTPSGGTAPYTYVWSDGPTTQDRTGLAAGSYSVTITDNVGATLVHNVTIL